MLRPVHTGPCRGATMEPESISDPTVLPDRGREALLSPLEQNRSRTKACQQAIYQLVKSPHYTHCPRYVDLLPIGDVNTYRGNAHQHRHCRLRPSSYSGSAVWEGGTRDHFLPCATSNGLPGGATRNHYRNTATISALTNFGASAPTTSTAPDRRTPSASGKRSAP